MKKILLTMALAISLITAADNYSPGKIRGQCMMQASDMNPAATPCVALVLILTDTAGKELSRTRTDAKGLFEFQTSANEKGPFRITSGVRFYEPTKPKATVQAGQSIELQLKQK